MVLLKVIVLEKLPQFHVQPISTDILGATRLHDFEGITPTVANVRPTSRGEINIISDNIKDYPKNKK